MIKRHDIRPRRKRGGAGRAGEAGPESSDAGDDSTSDEGVNDEGEEVGVD
jgi:hypothetical protein